MLIFYRIYCHVNIDTTSNIREDDVVKSQTHSVPSSISICVTRGNTSSWHRQNESLDIRLNYMITFL